MSNGVLDALDSLMPKFHSAISSADKEKIDLVYAYYCRDFFDNPFQVDNKTIKIKDDLYTNNIADGLPDFYCGYHEKFVHLITREASGRTKVLPKHRIFKENRLKRIHWIKPILQHWNDPRITYFYFLEDNRDTRQYFWYKAKDYIVILQELPPDLYFITGFCVDFNNRSYYDAKYNARCGP
jgi:hypothetical protein